jgi:integrase/recombinase XerD
LCSHIFFRIFAIIIDALANMPGRQAKTLSAADLNDLLVFASCTRRPLRNTVMVLLSAKAGLRAGESARG